MSDQEENVAIVRGALEAFQRGDIETMLAMLHPEVEVFSSPQLANPAHFVGREGWTQWAGEWFDAWENFEVEAEAIEPVGQHHVLLPAVQRGTGKGSGIEVEMNVCYMLELHQGLATRYHLYPDRDQALEAAREGESG